MSIGKMVREKTMSIGKMVSLGNVENIWEDKWNRQICWRMWSKDKLRKAKKVDSKHGASSPFQPAHELNSSLHDKEVPSQVDLSRKLVRQNGTRKAREVTKYPHHEEGQRHTLRLLRSERQPQLTGLWTSEPGPTASTRSSRWRSTACPRWRTPSVVPYKYSHRRCSRCSGWLHSHLDTRHVIE